MATKKLVPNVSITVIRDGKRVTPPSGPGAKAFPFTDEEIKSVTAQMPNAFRTPVNEVTDDETTPSKEGDKGAADTPKRPAKEKAAAKSSTSKKATANKTDTPANAEQESQDADEDEAETDADEDADEDEDI